MTTAETITFTADDAIDGYRASTGHTIIRLYAAKPGNAGLDETGFRNAHPRGHRCAGRTVESWRIFNADGSKLSTVASLAFAKKLVSRA